MVSVTDEFLAANARYAAGFTKGDLPRPPGRRAAVLLCMDARIDPAKVLGLEEGDANVIRNACGRASEDAIRSLVISYKLLRTREFMVIHHTDCGMVDFINEQLRDQLKRDLGGRAGDRLLAVQRSRRERPGRRGDDPVLAGGATGHSRPGFRLRRAVGAVERGRLNRVSSVPTRWRRAGVARGLKSPR